MKQILLVVGLLVLLSPAATALSEYFTSECEYTLRGDSPVGFAAVQVTDFDGDGKQELIAGAEDGIVYNFPYGDCVDWKSNWMVNTEGVVGDMALADVNGDGKDELLVAVYNSEKAYLFVVNNKGIVDLDTKSVGGAAYAVHAGDLDGDGRKEILLGSKSQKVYAIKGRTLYWEYLTDYPVYYVHAKDLDADGKQEVVALSKKYRYAKLYVLDSKGAKNWDYVVDGGVDLSSKNTVGVVDLNKDGKEEIVVGSNSGLVVLSSDGKVEWSYDTLDDSKSKVLVSSIHSADVDKDGYPELIVGATPYAYAIKKDGSVLWKTKINTTIYSTYSADVNDDGNTEIIVGARRYVHVLDSNGKSLGVWNYKEEIRGQDYKGDFDIEVYDNLKGQRLYKVKDAKPGAMAAGDLDGDGDPEVAVGFGYDETTIRGNIYHGDLRVFELNKDYSPGEAATTLAPSSGGLETTTQNAEASMLASAVDSDVGSEPASSEKEANGRICCTPFLPGILVLSLSLLLNINSPADKGGL